MDQQSDNSDAEEDEDEEEIQGSESEIDEEEDQSEGSDSDESGQKGNVYKAPKMTSVAFEDKADRKARQKDAYEKKKMGKSALMQEMRRELMDEPEEIHMAVGKKTKSSKYEDMLEDMEMDNFKRVSLTKKEKKAMRQRRQEDLEDRLDNLDDDFAAIEKIVARSGRKQADEAAEKSAMID